MIAPGQRFHEIAQQLRQGTPRSESVRTVLSWFSFQRRSAWVVDRIRAELTNAGLETSPDVWDTYLDGYLRFALRQDREEEPSTAPAVEALVETTPQPEAATTAPPDPTYRLARLPSANATPLSVHPDDLLKLAVSHMIKKEFSQLPVMETPYRLKGIISWASIARRQCLGIAVAKVGDCIDPPQVLDLDTSLFSAIESIYRNDYALVRHPDNRIGGIVTTADLTLEFHALAEPFLLIGEIENHLRHLIGSRFSLEELRQARNTVDQSRDVAAVDDLTLGEYIRLLQVDSNWNRLSLRLDRATFVEWLDQVRQVRNDVMHFDPDPVSMERLQLLREVTRMMQTLRRIGAV